MKTKPLTNIILGAVFGMISLVSVLPLLFVVAISLSSEESLWEYGYSFIPHEFSVEAYRYIFANAGFFGRSFLNSVIITVSGTLLSLFLISSMAYVMTRVDRRTERLLTLLIMIPMFFSGGLAASYVVNVRLFELKNTLLSMIVIPACSTWYIMVLRTYFRSNMNRSLIDSALMDGASEFQIYSRIVLPLSKPILATIGLFEACAYWNSWYYAMLYIDSSRTDLFPLQYTLVQMQQKMDYALNASDSISGLSAVSLPSESFRMAVVVMIILPVIFIYPFLSKYFVRGIMEGSVKE